MPESQQPTISETLQRALEASARDDAETALRLLHQATAEAPSSAVPQFLLGAELAQLGRIEDAEAAYANAVLLAPGLHIARYELGTLQFTSGRAALALVTWQPLTQLADSDPLRMFVKGYTELAQDGLDAALKWFKLGIDANTENPALNGNIRLLMASIEKARERSLPEVAEPDSDGAHFLVSNYGRHGPLH